MKPILKNKQESCKAWAKVGKEFGGKEGKKDGKGLGRSQSGVGQELGQSWQELALSSGMPSLASQGRRTASRIPLGLLVFKLVDRRMILP